MKQYVRFVGIIFIFVIVFLYGRAFFIKGHVPIPSDIIVGLYHPFRDFYAHDYPNGVPVKNFLLSDPVRQQYPWKQLVVETEKKWQLPLWNPYTFSGGPLLAQVQSGVFYPVSILFFLFPFSFAWSIFILLQPLLAAVFLYWYLRNMKLEKVSSVLGACVFALSGFSVAWLEWGNIVQVLLWLPLLLLSIDKLFFFSLQKKSISLQWSAVFVGSLLCSFFAGHLQLFFYVFIVCLLYITARLVVHPYKRIGFLFVGLIAFFTLLSAVQWFPTLQFLLVSARDVDRFEWARAGWFIPWQHLVQFVVPDFFGNPSYMDYWGIWNYAELVGYIGLLPLFFSFIGMTLWKNRRVRFFTVLLFGCFVFALPTYLATLPFVLHIPFLSTSQPTRLMGIIDFSFSVLSALGFSYLMKNKKRVLVLGSIFLSFFVCLWIMVLFFSAFTTPEHLVVAKKNLLFSSLLAGIGAVGIGMLFFFKDQKKHQFIMICLLVFCCLDLLRFGDKFTPFSQQAFLFPQTKTIAFLQTHMGNHRMMEVDWRVLPPNFSIPFHLQSISGYDPLFTRRYAEFMSASERQKPDITPPFGFNRIITPYNYKSPLVNLLGVKYVLSFFPLTDPKLTLVFQEGQTHVYENREVLPRAFFVSHLSYAQTNDEAIHLLMDKGDFLRNAVIEDGKKTKEKNLEVSQQAKAEIIRYEANMVVVRTQNTHDGFLVLTDSFYPGWHAVLDEKRQTRIYLTDYNFRGVFVPKGEHTVTYSMHIL